MGRAQEGICWLCPPLRRGWGAAYFVFEADQTSRVTQGPEPWSRPVPRGTSGRPACPRGGFSDTLFGQTHSPPAAHGHGALSGALRCSGPKFSELCDSSRQRFAFFPLALAHPAPAGAGKRPPVRSAAPILVALRGVIDDSVPSWAASQWRCVRREVLG